MEATVKENRPALKHALTKTISLPTAFIAFVVLAAVVAGLYYFLTPPTRGTSVQKTEMTVVAGGSIVAVAVVLIALDVVSTTSGGLTRIGKASWQKVVELWPPPKCDEHDLPR